MWMIGLLAEQIEFERTFMSNIFFDDERKEARGGKSPVGHREFEY